MHVMLRGIDRAAVSFANDDRQFYRGLFEHELSAELLPRVRDCANGGFVLGAAKFERQIAVLLGRRTWKGLAGRPRKDPHPDRQGKLGL
jgi:putative transposase